MEGPICHRRVRRRVHENAKLRMTSRGISMRHQYHRSRCFTVDNGGSSSESKIGINISGGSSTPRIGADSTGARHCGRTRSRRVSREVFSALLLVLIGAHSTSASPAPRAQETFKELPAPSNLILDAGPTPTVIPIPPSSSSVDRAASKPVSPALIAVLVVCSVLIVLSGLIWFHFHRKRRREAAQLLLNSPDSLDKDVILERRWTTYTDSRMGGIFSQQQQNPWSVDGRKSGYSGYSGSSGQSSGERKQNAWTPPPPLHSQAFAAGPRTPISPVHPNAALAMNQRPETQYEAGAGGGVWGPDGRYWHPRWEGGARAELMTASMYSRAESRGGYARMSVADSVDTTTMPGEQSAVVVEQARVVRMAPVGRV